MGWETPDNRDMLSLMAVTQDAHVMPPTESDTMNGPVFSSAWVDMRWEDRREGREGPEGRVWIKFTYMSAATMLRKVQGTWHPESPSSDA